MESMMIGKGVKKGSKFKFDCTFAQFARVFLMGDGYGRQREREEKGIEGEGMGWDERSGEKQIDRKMIQEDSKGEIESKRA